MISFVINVADESQEQVDYCLQHLRCHYPESKVSVINDGSQFDFQDVTKKHNCKYIKGAYLKRTECGGQWWHRTLGISDTDWLVKLDPDTRIHRRFKGAPGTEIAGHIHNPGVVQEVIQGGCQWFHRSAIEKILKSKILLSPTLRSKYGYYPKASYEWVLKGYLSSDYQLMYICKKLGIHYGGWDEIGSFSEYAPSNYKQQCAVTHPVKFTRHIIGVTSDTELHAIITCKGRQEHLLQTLPNLLAQVGMTVTVVDYDCPQDTKNVLRSKYPNVRVVEYGPDSEFHLNRARNLGASDSPQGWLCFLDSDLLVSPGWAEKCREKMEKGYYYTASPVSSGISGSCIVHSDDYHQVGGYDELYKGWGCDDLDFYAMLRSVGVRPGNWRGDLAKTLDHSDQARTAFQSRSKEHNHLLSSEYYRNKVQWVVEHNRLPILHDKLRFKHIAESKLEFLDKMSESERSNYFKKKETRNVLLHDQGSIGSL